MPMMTFSFKLDAEQVARVDALAVKMSESASGARITRANALRTALDIGLAHLEEQHKPKRPKK